MVVKLNIYVYGVVLVVMGVLLGGEQPTGAGLDRGDVGVDQDGIHPFFLECLECLECLGLAVFKFARLPDLEAV